MLVADLCARLDERFPLSNAASWDPVGLQVGDPESDLGSVAVVHEVTEDVVASAVSGGIGTLVSYHPLLFERTNRLVAGPTPQGRALRLAQSGITLVIVHTALDGADFGTGDALLTAIGIPSTGSFAASPEDEEPAIGRFGTLEQPMTVENLSNLLSDVLDAGVRTAGPTDRSVDTIATVPGSGAAFLGEAAKRADVLITGDVSHHQARAAVDNGLVVLDAGHIPSERPGVEYLYDSVRQEIPGTVLIASDPHPWEDDSWKT